MAQGARTLLYKDVLNTRNQIAGHKADVLLEFLDKQSKSSRAAERHGLKTKR